MHNTPLSLIEALLAARSTGNMAGAILCYESTALIAVEPGKFLSGPDVIRGFNEAVSRLNITFVGHSILEGDGVAIHYAAWIRQDTVNGEMSTTSGVTTDVLRLNTEGSWLMSIDNPWGAHSVIRAE